VQSAILRTAPAGVESASLANQLHDVGTLVNQETAQLVEAVVTLSLDQEDTDKAIARISIEANLASARTDDQAQTISLLTAELAAEKTKCEQAEAGAKKTGAVLEELMTEVKVIKDTMTNAWQTSPSQAGLVKVSKLGGSGTMTTAECLGTHMNMQVLAPSIDSIERQLYANIPPGANEASSTPLASSLFTSEPARTSRAQRAASPIKEEEDGPTAGAFERQNRDLGLISRSTFENVPIRPATAFQPMARSPPVLAPPRFGNALQAQGMPPRGPSALSQERRLAPRNMGQQAYRAVSGGNASNVTNSAFAPLTAPGPGNFQPLPRYRPTAPEFYPSTSFATAQAQPQGGVAITRPGSAFGHRSQLQVTTPTSGGRNRSNSRYGRAPESIPAGNIESPSPSFALMSRASSSNLARPIAAAPNQLTPQVVSAWNERIMDFYGKIRTFVERHASDAERGPLAHVAGTSLWHTLLATYRPLSDSEAASYLEFHLRNENSKACVVTRLIIDYVVNRVWVPVAWAGSDSQMTCELMDLSHELEATAGESFGTSHVSPHSGLICSDIIWLPTGQPSSARQPLLNRQAAIINHVLRNEQGTTLHQSRVSETTRSLYAALQPLMNKHSGINSAMSAAAAVEEARCDLAAVAESAWDISAKMLTSRLMFDFRFPEISSRFSSQSMLPIWPHTDPAELQAKHFRVALVATPVITCRNETGMGISAHSIALADVFCMQ